MFYPEILPYFDTEIIGNIEFYSTGEIKTIVDVEIYSGDAFFAEPIDKRGKGYFDDISFVELTNEQKLEYREKMRLKIKEYK